MLRRLRGWLTRRFSPSIPATRAEAQEAAQEAREDRATLVTELQAEVRSLQQQITDLTAVVGSDSGGGDHKIDLAKLVELERALEEKQQELARYQARV